MSRLSKIFVALSLLALIGFFGFFNERTALGHSVGDTTEKPILKADVFKNLAHLADVSGRHLNESQIIQITASCQDFIDSDISASFERLEVNEGKYEQFISTVELSLSFVINNLKQIAMDYSAVDVLQERLLEIKTELSLAIELYGLSLNKLLILSEDCRTYPDFFVAGLGEAHENNELVLAAAGDLLDFINTDFKETLMKIRSKLLTLEN